MGFVFKEGTDIKKATVKMTVLVTIALALAVLLGDVVFPLLAAFFAVLVIVDASKNKSVSRVASAVMLILSVMLFLFDVGTLAIPCACASGWLIARMFLGGVSKGEIAVYITLTALVMTVGSLYLLLAEAAGSFELNAVIECGKTLYTAMRDEFVESLITNIEGINGMTPEMLEIFDEQSVAKMFDEAFNLSFAVLVIASFMFAGITLKIFSGMIYKLAENKQRVVYWRFSTSNVIAYFYCAVLVLNFFAAGSSVFSIAVNNLFYIFMAVYGYIGYNFALSLLSRRFSFVLSAILIVVAIAALGTFAVEILSVFGVVFTHISNRVGSNMNNGNS